MILQLSHIVENLAQVSGVKAIALGGSQSRGEADAHSDFDFGVYYAGTLDAAALQECLKSLDDGHRDNLLNPPGEWGPWINGGGWLTVEGVPVDVLLRDIERVEEVVADCIAGRVTIDYQSGHPFGFTNTIYAAETHYCQPLWQDDSLPLERLKSLLYSRGKYSPAMREVMVRKFLWEAWFSLACGRKAALKGDINYAMGSAFRSVCAWVEVIYALNDSYLMNEKGSLSRIEHLDRKPTEMQTRVHTAYGLFAAGKGQQAYEIMDELHAEIEGLTGETEPVVTKIR